MTKDEIFVKYGTVPLWFSSYYKYVFTFRGVAPDGTVICVSIGGSAEDIYRFSVERNEEVTLGAEYSYAMVSNADGEELWSESNAW